jgi:hypothetical protein
MNTKKAKPIATERVLWSDVIESAVAEGLLEIVGRTDDGELIYRRTSKKAANPHVE